MLLPKRVKHRKVMRGRMSGQAKGGHYVAFGDYGLPRPNRPGSPAGRSRLPGAR